jgi:hypothetical protein
VACNVVPEHRPAGGPTKFRRTGGRDRPGAGRGRPGGSPSLIWEVGRGGDDAGGGSPWRGRAASAWRLTPANGRRRLLAGTMWGVRAIARRGDELGRQGSGSGRRG